VRSQRRRIGDIVKIALGDGTHTYARVLPEASFAFYDWCGSEDLQMDRIVKLPISFFVSMVNEGITSGRWLVVGRIPQNDGLKAPPRFIQDALDKRQFSIYDGGQIRPATRQECVGLERAAVWQPEHVEERLRDHFAGRKNEIHESLKMKSFQPN